MSKGICERSQAEASDRIRQAWSGLRDTNTAFQPTGDQLLQLLLDGQPARLRLHVLVVLLAKLRPDLRY